MGWVGRRVGILCTFKTGELPQTGLMQVPQQGEQGLGRQADALERGSRQAAAFSPTYSCGWQGLSGPCSSITQLLKSSYCSRRQPSGGCCSQSRSSLCGGGSRGGNNDAAFKVQVSVAAGRSAYTLRPPFRSACR
jgi:hypothetical protein